jgi:hypothetical protein
MLDFLKDFYLNVRNTLVWFVIYFVLQAVIWVALAILVILYPQALVILAAIFFFILSVVSLFLAFVVIKYVKKLKKVKDLLSGDFK